MIFRGGPVLALDTKGRVTVPSRWRDHLVATVQGQLMITKHPDGCVALYPMPVWDEFEASVLALPSDQDNWRRFYMGSATEVEIDSGSRILIPPELRSWAFLDKEVKFMGMGSHFEIWDPVRHEARETVSIAQGRPESLRNMVVR
jgi:MraZ protein